MHWRHFNSSQQEISSDARKVAADLLNPDVRVDGCGLEGDVNLGMLVGGQEARGWEGSKVRSQSSHIQGKLGAYVTTVLHLDPLRRLHQYLHVS